jgi:hypothetical protein
MKRLTKLVLIAVAISIVGLVTLPFWGMGPAVFLDSERTVISRAKSPDGARTAQVERIVIGGVPSIVIVVRRWWMPDWYLAGCAAASHYQEAKASVRWVSNGSIEVRHTDGRLFWDETGHAPFHNKTCGDLSVTFDEVRR